MYDKKAVSKYREKNKEAILEYQREYYKKNKEKRLEYKKEWYERKKEEIKEGREETINIGARINKETVNKIKARLEKEGRTFTEFMKQAIEEYLQNHE